MGRQKKRMHQRERQRETGLGCVGVGESIWDQRTGGSELILKLKVSGGRIPHMLSCCCVHRKAGRVLPCGCILSCAVPCLP